MTRTPSPGDDRGPDDPGLAEHPHPRRAHREMTDGSSRQSGQTPVTQLRRTYALTALGTLVPGAGLALTRLRGVGIALLVLALVLLLGLTWYVAGSGLEEAALALGSRPQLLRTLGLVAAGFTVLWMASVALTALTSRPRSMSSGQRVGLTGFTALMCLLLAAPTALGLRYIDAHSDAVDKIFLGRQDTPRNESLAAPDLDFEDPWEGTPRVNVLMLGTDAADDREGVRTDSMLVASIDTMTGDAVLFGIPRNLEMVPIPDSNPLSQIWPGGYDCGDACLMNGIWTEAEAAAEANPQLFAGDPNPGLTATQDVIGEILGLPIDNTVIVNLEGFEGLIDAMGGVEIDVQERLPMGGRTTTDPSGAPMLVPGSESGYLEPGLQELSGYQALWYARSRITTDDFSRMRRQRCVVAAVIEQVDPITMIQRYPQIVGVAGDNVTVDISQDELPAWAELVRRVQDGTIRSLPFTAQNTDVTDPNYFAIRAKVQAAIAPPEPEPTPSAAPTTVPGTTGDAAPTTAEGSVPEETTEAEETTEPETTETESPAVPTEDELEDVGVVC